MSRKFHLEQLESRVTPSAIGAGDPLNFKLVVPVSTPVQVAPTNISQISGNGVTVVIGIAIADSMMPSTSNMSPQTLPTLNPITGAPQPYQYYSYDPNYYAWLINPL